MQYIILIKNTKTKQIKTKNKNKQKQNKTKQKNKNKNYGIFVIEHYFKGSLGEKLAESGIFSALHSVPL